MSVMISPVTGDARIHGPGAAVPTAAPSSPSLLFLVGPPAVGKMTVGLELAALTGFRLLHNHLTIDLVTRFFDFGTAPFSRLVSAFRQQIVAEVAASDLPGLVFTIVWAFDHPADGVEIDRYTGLFHEHGRAVGFVELAADQQERLRRNRTTLRMEHKPSKRDLEWSDANLIALDNKYQLSSPPERRDSTDWFYLDTTQLPAQAAAELIMERFALPRVGCE